jgi:hypothetical protein
LFFFLGDKSFVPTVGDEGAEGGENTSEAISEYMDDIVKSVAGDGGSSEDEGMAESEDEGEAEDGSGGTGEEAGVLNPGSAVGGSRCPVAFPTPATPVVYHESNAAESWSAYSEAPCEDVAREFLYGLRDAGTELVSAGYLDLSGAAWGCTVACEDGSSLVITLVPEALGRVRDEDNRLRVSVVRFKPLG